MENEHDNREEGTPFPAGAFTDPTFLKKVEVLLDAFSDDPAKVRRAAIAAAKLLRPRTRPDPKDLAAREFKVVLPIGDARGLPKTFKGVRARARGAGKRPKGRGGLQGMARA